MGLSVAAEISPEALVFITGGAFTIRARASSRACRIGGYRTTRYAHAEVSKRWQREGINSDVRMSDNVIVPFVMRFGLESDLSKGGWVAFLVLPTRFDSLR
jgi:hypothetical protein